MDSAGLYYLTGVEDLAISIRGRNFSEDDVDTFHKAMGDLPHLQRLHLFVTAEALDEARELFHWPCSRFSVEIEVEKPARRARKPIRRSPTQA